MSEKKSTEKSERLLTILHAISEIVNAGLNKEAIAICVEMIESGVSAKSLVKIVKSIREDIENPGLGELHLKSYSEKSDDSPRSSEKCPPTHRTV
ncbi:mitotic-spindle organizing protein 1 [Drosophila ficusphila]|uniref:mitotic-spindle organizing protein 1 n=1 Tax=Drosophila ficusphila TaxID=30025 RepID=UPI0007E6A60B|nr:mitotic-spindle organizing protein 1 [Drosophila ficusphila]